jgi:hypothetical protein
MAHRLGTELSIGCEHTRVENEVDARLRDLRSKPFHQLDWVQAQMRRAVTPPRLEREQVPAIGQLLVPVVGERRSRAVAHQSLDACALASAEGQLTMQVEAVHVPTRHAAKARKTVGEHAAAQEALERLVDERGYAARFAGCTRKRRTLLRHEPVQRRGGRVPRKIGRCRRQP